MPYTEVYIGLDDFDDDDLIDEIESRGWWVSPEKHWISLDLTVEEKAWICEKILAENLDVKDLVAKEIYEKLRKK